MIFIIDSGKPILKSVNVIFWCPCIVPSLKNARAMTVGYCVCSFSKTSTYSTESTHCHLRVVCILVRGDPDGRLDGALDIALIRIHLHELEPRFLRVPGGVKATLVCLLSLLLVVQTQPKVAKDLPLVPCLAIRNSLRFEVSDLGAEDRPYSQVLTYVS